MTNLVSEQNTLFNGQKTLTFSFSFSLFPHAPTLLTPYFQQPPFHLTLSKEKGPGSNLLTPIHLCVALRTTQEEESKLISPETKSTLS